MTRMMSLVALWNGQRVIHQDAVTVSRWPGSERWGWSGKDVTGLLLREIDKGPRDNQRIKHRTQLVAEAKLKEHVGNCANVWELRRIVVPDGVRS